MADLMLINGEFRGKVGQLCGEKWKNKRVVKAKSVPRDPKSKKQTDQRERFTTLDNVICPNVVDMKKYGNYDLSKMSTHNAFLKLNHKFCETGDAADIVVTKGTLQPVDRSIIQTTTTQYNGLNIEWGFPALMEEWLANGIEMLAICSWTGNNLKSSGFFKLNYNRDGTFIPVPSDNEGTFRFWIWTYKKTNGIARVSSSYTETFFIRH